MTILIALLLGFALAAPTFLWLGHSYGQRQTARLLDEQRQKFSEALYQGLDSERPVHVLRTLYQSSLEERHLRLVKGRK